MGYLQKPLQRIAEAYKMFIRINRNPAALQAVMQVLPPKREQIG